MFRACVSRVLRAMPHFRNGRWSFFIFYFFVQQTTNLSSVIVERLVKKRALSFERLCSKCTHRYLRKYFETKGRKNEIKGDERFKADGTMIEMDRTLFVASADSWLPEFGAPPHTNFAYSSQVWITLSSIEDSFLCRWHSIDVPASFNLGHATGHYI